MTSWKDVPGWYDFDDIYREAVAIAPHRGAHFVEVGTFFGRSTIHLAEMIRDSGKQISLDAIDPSRLDPPSLPLSEDMRPFASMYGGIRQVFEHFSKEAGVRHFINVVPHKDHEVVDRYENGSLDLFFLDADHTYEGTKASILMWLPKMKPGAIFAGHDYVVPGWPGVKQAVDEVLGNKISVKGLSFYMRV